MQDKRLDLSQRIRRLEARFQKAKEFDSYVFIEVPQPNLELGEYRDWLIEEVETKWMKEFNSNEHYFPSWHWNEEGGINGKFGEDHIIHCKFYHYDGTEGIMADDLRSKRGLLIRDHYSPFDVAKVHIIADNLCKFLTQEGIVYERINIKRDQST